MLDTDTKVKNAIALLLVASALAFIFVWIPFYGNPMIASWQQNCTKAGGVPIRVKNKLLCLSSGALVKYEPGN